jgi:hypothetical protein
MNIAPPSTISAVEAFVYSSPNATRRISFGANAKTRRAGTVIRAASWSARTRMGRGSRPLAARRVASGSRCRPTPIAIHTNVFAATAAAA